MQRKAPRITSLLGTYLICMFKYGVLTSSSNSICDILYIAYKNKKFWDYNNRKQPQSIRVCI